MGEGVGLSLSAIFCVWAPSSSQKGSAIKSGGRAGPALLWVAWKSKVSFLKMSPQHLLKLLGTSLVAFGISVDRESPEFNCLIFGGLVIHQSLRTREIVCSVIRRPRAGFRGGGPRRDRVSK